MKIKINIINLPNNVIRSLNVQRARIHKHCTVVRTVCISIRVILLSSQIKYLCCNQLIIPVIKVSMQYLQIQYHSICNHTVLYTVSYSKLIIKVTVLNDTVCKFNISELWYKVINLFYEQEIINIFLTK